MEYFNALHGTSVVEMSSLKGENRKGSGNIEFLMLNYKCLMDLSSWEA
jgi:hypothetical protein